MEKIWQYGSQEFNTMIREWNVQVKIYVVGLVDSDFTLILKFSIRDISKEKKHKNNNYMMYVNTLRGIL